MTYICGMAQNVFWKHWHAISASNDVFRCRDCILLPVLNATSVTMDQQPIIQWETTTIMSDIVSAYLRYLQFNKLAYLSEMIPKPRKCLHLHILHTHIHTQKYHMWSHPNVYTELLNWVLKTGILWKNQFIWIKTFSPRTPSSLQIFLHRVMEVPAASTPL